MNNHQIEPGPSGWLAALGGIGDLTMMSVPLAPWFMRMKNRSEDRRRCQEMADLGLPPPASPSDVLEDTLELCANYEQLQPENSFHWQRAREYAVAHATGPSAMLKVVEQWGFVTNRRGELEVPEWWSGKMALPLEFMDYFPERYPEDALRAAGVEPGRFHALAKQASDLTWMGFYRAKGALNFRGVSLLTKEIVDAVRALKQCVKAPGDGPLRIYVIGISEDEIAALRGPDVAVIGFNLGYSPVLERFVQRGRVVPALVGRDAAGRATGLLDAETQEPLRPKAGTCYVCNVDVAKDGLPVPDASGIVMTNFTLHHNSFPEQAAMIREMNRAALPHPAGGRCWVAGELCRIPGFVRVLLASSSMYFGAWDAWVSFANGIVCVEELIRRQEEWAAEGVKMRFNHVPGGLAGAPAVVHRLIMPTTQALIMGY